MLSCEEYNPNAYILWQHSSFCQVRRLLTWYDFDNDGQNSGDEWLESDYDTFTNIANLGYVVVFSNTGTTNNFPWWMDSQDQYAYGEVRYSSGPLAFCSS
ncbi:MAG: hypothetical protein ACRERU_04445 [Methylococcales bacterium]